MGDVFISVDTWKRYDNGAIKRTASFPVSGTEEADDVAIFFVAHKLGDVVQIVQHNPYFILTEWTDNGADEYDLWGSLPTQTV